MRHDWLNGGRVLAANSLVTIICIACFLAFDARASDSSLADGGGEKATIDLGTHLGGGSDISPDGKLVAYVGSSGLYVRDLATGNDRLLINRVAPGLDVFDRPTFTPDGRTVLVSVSGGTWYYPADIYAVPLSGAGAIKLTTSTHSRDQRSNSTYSEYFYEAVASKSSLIAIWIYDPIGDTNKVGVLDSVSLSVRTIGDGRPLFWDVDGSLVYVLTDDKVKAIDVRNGTSRVIELHGDLIGRLRGEIFAVDDGDKILFENGAAIDAGIVPSDIPRMQKILLPFGVGMGGQRSENLVLSSIHSSQSAKMLLLHYSGPFHDRLEIRRAAPSW